MPIALASQGGVGFPDYHNHTLLFDSLYHKANVNILPFTIPKDGWLKITSSAYSPKNKDSIITINGIQIADAFSGATENNLDQVNMTSLWMVKKGDILQVPKIGYGHTIIYFMPFRTN